MVNLLGDLWQQGEPVWDRALQKFGCPPPPLRQIRTQKWPKKWGHLTVLADTAEQALQQALNTRRSLGLDAVSSREIAQNGHILALLRNEVADGSILSQQRILGNSLTRTVLLFTLAPSSGRYNDG